MKKQIKLMITILMVMPMMFVLVACGSNNTEPNPDPQPTRLAAPTTNPISGTTFSWNSVSGSVGYEWRAVPAMMTPIFTNATSVSLAGFPVGVHNLQVRAMGDGETYLYSNWSTFLTFTVNPEAVTFTVEVIGGTGGGTFNEGTQVTIASDDSFFLWWQLDGQNTMWSQNQIHTFTPTGDVIVRSVGSERHMGVAIHEFVIGNQIFIPGSVYNFTSPGFGQAHVNNVPVSASFNNGTFWDLTSGFASVNANPGGQTVFNLQNGNTHAHMILWIYTDINNVLRAEGLGIATVNSNALVRTVQLPDGRSIRLQRP